LLDKIMKKREQLYKQLNSKPIDSEEILKTSQELDKLMLEYYKNKEIDYKRIIEFRLNYVYSGN